MLGHLLHALEPDAAQRALAGEEASIFVLFDPLEAVLDTDDEAILVNVGLDADVPSFIGIGIGRDTLTCLDRVFDGIAEDRAKLVFVDIDFLRQVDFCRNRYALLPCDFNVAADDTVAFCTSLFRGLRCSNS